MGPANRQDVQNIVNSSVNRLLQQVPTKQDVVVLNDSIRNLSNLSLQAQQLLKQADYQRSQQSRRVVATETRLANVENELRTTQAVLQQLVEQRTQQVVMPSQADQQGGAGAYVYRAT